MSYKRKLELTIRIHDGMYCNVGAKETCRFCVKHCNGHTCTLNQEVLNQDGKMIIKTQECMWLNPATQVYEEPDVQVSTKTLVDTTVDYFVKIYKSLRKSGLNEEMSLTAAQKEVKK